MGTIAMPSLSPLPVLGAPPRFRVLRPIRVRRLSDELALVLHPPSGSWVMVKVEAADLVQEFLDACESSDFEDPALKRSPLFDRLRNSGLIRDQLTGAGCHGGCGSGSGSLGMLILKLVGFCDLACDYCYDFRAENYSRRLSDEVAQRAIVDSLARSGPMLKILFHGGEPLLALDQIRRLVPFAREAARAAEREVCFAVQTNGRHFSPATVDFLLENRVSIGLSLDGPAALNDRHRVDHSGRGRFNEIEDALRSNPRLLAKVAVLTTVTRTNAAHLLETARYLRDLGIKHWDTTLFQPLGRAAQKSQFAPDTDVVIQSYFELFDAVEAGEFDQMTVAPVLRYLRNVLSGDRRAMCLRDGCGAARDLVSISVDGTIESCDCIGDRTLSLGHMERDGIAAALDSPIADTIRSRSTRTLSPCPECDWRSFCGGTCLARSGLERIDEVECQIAMALFPDIFRRLATSDRLERYARPFP
jgi:uncharacterized protein